MKHITEQWATEIASEMMNYAGIRELQDEKLQLLVDFCADFWIDADEVIHFNIQIFGVQKVPFTIERKSLLVGNQVLANIDYCERDVLNGYVKLKGWLPR